MGSSSDTPSDSTGVLIQQIEKVLIGIGKGSYQERVRPDGLPADLQEIARVVNNLVETMQNRAAWYESILDAVPFPITVTDMDSRWTFVNKAVEGMLKVSRKDIEGHTCSEWGAGICNTDKCGITRLRAGFSNTKFEQFGGHFNVDCAYVTDAQGKRIGHVEVVTDITDLVKVSKYLHKEVDHTAANLEKLARGDLHLDYTVEPADEHTREASELFVQVNKSLGQATNALSLMIADVQMLSDAAQTGNLKIRADTTRHKGDYQKIVSGVNSTLDSVITPIEEALRVSTDYAHYNFRTRINPSLHLAGDWLVFKGALDNIGIQITDAIQVIDKKVVDLTANAEEAAASIQDVASGSNRIAINASRVSQNANEGEEGVTQILQAMEDLSATVGSVSRRAEQVSSTAEEANRISKTGMELAGRTETAMKGITESTDEVGILVHEINDQMREIGKIVKVITDIANQTNLLALNAAIEAARAGEAGRGFAVVAAEVKSLALDSRSSAENIADMITNLQKKAENANGAIGRAGTTVNEGSAALGETLVAFQKIGETIEEISRSAMDVASASEEQAASVQEVTASIGEVSTYIKNTSEEAISAAAATEEASAAADQISHIVVNLNSIVEAVSHEVNKFQV
ncbi:MAG TPA: methyl-accepting chemotaxis protein [Methanospirillum sp.]|nr:methyl-accepting chemotaxis protein [Methanospirillum sp.]